MRISILAQLLLSLCLSNTMYAGHGIVSEEAELVSYAQDIYRIKGINISRSAFELKEMQDWGRVFFIRIFSRRSTLSEDLLQGFLVGGAVSQHARSPIDQIMLIVEIEFSHEKMMVLRSEASCCEELYNNRMTPEVFTENCLQIDYKDKMTGI